MVERQRYLWQRGALQSYKVYHLSLKGTYRAALSRLGERAWLPARDSLCQRSVGRIKPRVMTRKAAREQLEFLVKMSHPEVVKAALWLRNGGPPDERMASIKIVSDFMRISLPKMQKNDIWYLAQSDDQIVSIASLSSNETIREAYEDYLRSICCK